MKSMLAQAIKIAVDAHNGQFDKGGNAYILHPLKVMHYLKSDDEELQAIAVLHDVIEDSDITYSDLSENGMTERVVSALRLLTKVRGQTHEEYLSGICSSKDAVKVKLADLRHNSDIRRLKSVTEKDIRRVEKYHKMYLQIKSCLES